MQIHSLRLLVPQLRTTRGEVIALVVYVLLVSAIIFACFGDRHYDDPYISYRYAQNLAGGEGFVYNRGEYVQSTTTPLFTLILALAALVTQDLPTAANIVGALCLAAGALCLGCIFLSDQQRLAALIVLVAYPAYPLLVNTLGSEIPLFLLLCLLSFYASLQQRYNLTAMCLALATLTRPEGALAAVAVFIGAVWRYRMQVVEPRFLCAAGLYASLISAWLLMSWMYFGNPLPVTLYAKQAQGALPISVRYLPGLMAMVSQSIPQPALWFAAVLAFIGGICALKRKHAVLLIVSWAVMHTLAYGALGVSRYFWYYAPVVTGLITAVAIGAEHAVQWVSRVAPRASKVIGALLLGAVVATMALSAVTITQTSNRRTEIYRTAGEWLRANTSADDSVGALEVGAVGYYAQRRIIDFAGLIQPDVAQRLWLSQSYDETAIYAMDRHQPDYVAIRDDQVGPLTRSRLEQACRTVWHEVMDIEAGITLMVIFRCQGQSE